MCKRQSRASGGCCISACSLMPANYRSPLTPGARGRRQRQELHDGHGAVWQGPSSCAALRCWLGRRAFQGAQGGLPLTRGAQRLCSMLSDATLCDLHTLLAPLQWAPFARVVFLSLRGSGACGTLRCRWRRWRFTERARWVLAGRRQSLRLPDWAEHRSMAGSPSCQQAQTCGA